jgi:hypothetical protein
MSYLDDTINWLLTLRDILNLEVEIFQDANLAVSSACNIAVSTSPSLF